MALSMTYLIVNGLEAVGTALAGTSCGDGMLHKHTHRKDAFSLFKHVSVPF